MSVANYKATIWEDSIAENFAENTFVGLLTTPPVEVKGEKVVFNRIAPGAWKDYISGAKIEWSEVSTTKVELTFPKQKYYAFMLEDVDKCQLVGDVLNAVTKEQSTVLGEQIDSEVVTYIVETTPVANTIGSVTAQELVTKSNAYDLLVDLNTKANKLKVPVTERYFVISPDFLALLAKDSRFTLQYSILANGIVEGATINGAVLLVKADNPTDKVILTHKSATGYGMQLTGEPEAIRLQDYLADGVRGVVKYGYIQLRPESSCVAYIKY
ncbi:hypothetical protein LGL08_23035 [Clostridium estertheticum]|uniref:hypothetical protein n=1 Tax=Clostridium estertheticum TaxID=238834 RepID=UPI001CF371AE|nr:hypothetical protein [Clostridium estertheticum]MCB2309423.1 hypothetical protein [Clostridium estertheticum]MCB2347861.1 hypothetical protein [Clostridium estertheticum]MCB2352378.1 hypothetical protein [Clostridium estertheticum]WAG48568.1 hypothetical protein LL127_23740 [Clostridium estertheticum]